MINVIGDKVLIRIEGNAFGLIGAKDNELCSGVLEQVPNDILYYGFHSFGFDNSLGNDEVLAKVLDFYNKLIGKRVYWEMLQDRGRKFTVETEDGNKDYVLLNMSDVLFWTEPGIVASKSEDGLGVGYSFK